ncbi:MAG: hypothetical protein AUG74_05840 [Bacteroidetes bacterium 13_1_20CM_4_60_6]|nr:MAG: hypothetical protein AUG74_05840 [Bacteroidetes bacterium 13_1_20CM_4_60_6]
MQVLQPNGAPISLPSSTSATIPSATAGAGFHMATLPVAGTYTVVITPSNIATGTISVTLWRDVPDPLTIGTPYSLSIPFRNQVARLTFAGTAGDALALNLSNVTFPGGGTVQVFHPTLSNIGLPVVGTANFTTAGGVITFATLPGTATYTVVITPSASGIGGATVTVFRR